MRSLGELLAVGRALKSIFSAKLDALINGFKLANFGGRGVDQPQAITKLAVDKFFGADKPLNKFFGGRLALYEVGIIFRLNDECAAVGRTIAGGHVRHGAKRQGAALDKNRLAVKQIEVDVLRDDKIFARENFLGLGIGRGAEPDNDAVDVRHVGAFALPTKSPVREVNMNVATAENKFPNVESLLALRNGVCADERATDGVAAHELGDLEIPTGDVINLAGFFMGLAVLDEQTLHVSLLRLALIGVADERRIADDVVKMARLTGGKMVSTFNLVTLPSFHLKKFLPSTRRAFALLMLL